MGIQGYGIFQRLVRRANLTTHDLGLKGKDGDVQRWYARVKFARGFQGVQVDEYSERTVSGYSAFLKVFLTHSALKRYLPLIGLKKHDGLVNVETFRFLEPAERVEQFFAHDRSGKLFGFLHKHLRPDNRANLAACKDGSCCNVAHVSAAIRHIFAHGHLTPNCSGLDPIRVGRACETISDFLYEFMDYDFTARMAQAEKALGRSQAERGNPIVPPLPTRLD